MCVAVPGKVVEISDGFATVDYNSNRIKAGTGAADVKPGDYVLVHAGLIIQKLSESEALEMQELFSELEKL